MTDPPSQLKFYFDTHIPKAVATQLRNRGVEVVRCEEVELAEADDVEHLEYATALGLTLVSHDRDFWSIHGEWLSQGLHHTGIVLFNQRFQGQVGKLTQELTYIYEMIKGGAGTIEKDVYNQVYEIDR